MENKKSIWTQTVCIVYDQMKFYHDVNITAGMYFIYIIEFILFVICKYNNNFV